MLNHRLLYFLCILAFSSISYGQEVSGQELHGKLLLESNSLHLESIYVFNKQTKKGVLSDSLGNFKLLLRLGDTIIASAMQIEPSQIVVEEMHLKDAFITFPIQANIEYLEEVRLSNRSLTGNFDLDMKMLKTEPVITSADIGFPSLGPNLTVSERMLAFYTPYSLKNFNSLDIDWLYAVISGDLKRSKQRVSLEKREDKRLRIINRMPDSFYTSKLKINPENISHFIDFCESRNDIDMLISISIIDFIELLEKTAALYKDNYPEIF